MPAASIRSRLWSISALPATRTSGFGRVAVSGRIRLPSPAAITIALSIFALTTMPPPASKRAHWRRTIAETGQAPDAQDRVRARTEERRVGKECVWTGRSRVSQSTKKKNRNKDKRHKLDYTDNNTNTYTTTL